MQRVMRWVALCSVIMSVGLAFAQNTNSGDIRGTVTDPSGAVIPGVTVMVQDVDKGVTKTYITDGAGLYDTGPITPDHYTITFTKQNFNTYIRGPITLDVSTQTINAELKVGSGQQQVVVRAEVPLLQTESGAQEGTLSSQTMAQLPQVGADWQNFVTFMPGVAGTPENASNPTTPGQVSSVNGNLPYSSVLADGATTTLPMSQNSDVTIFETTAEVKVSDSAFSAQYGLGSIIYNQITKGGTNQFHGAGYEYFQNTALNAASYAFGTGAVPAIHYNNFGVAVGGPILRNKLFFFFDYDKTINNGAASTSFYTVPDQALMSGDFTAPGLPTLYDPTTQTIQQTGTYTYNTPDGSFTQTCPCAIRKSFAEEYGNGNRIPSAMMSAVAQKIQSYFPKPNNPPTSISSGIAVNNFTFTVPNSTPFTKYFGRLDWDITPSNRLTISETSSDNPAKYLSPVCPINCQNGDVSRDNAQVSDVWTFSPTFINEARFGFTDQLNFFTPFTINQGFPSTLGWQFAKADNFPNMNFSNFYNLASSSNAVYKEFVFDPSDVVTMIRGRHVLHFGGEFLINRADSTAWGNIDAGDLYYSGDYTSINGQPALTLGNGSTYASGLDYADFLLGQTRQWGANVRPEWGGRWKSPQLFIQDDFKIRPNLTLNLGLRYEIETGWSEVKGNMASFDPTVVNPANGSLGAMWFGITKANGRDRLQASKYNIVLPRIGFAWQVLQNTVIRGGWGIYASTWSADTYGSGLGLAFGSAGGYIDSTGGICPIVQLDADGSTPDTTNPGCGVGNFNSASLNSLYITAPTTPDALNGSSGLTYDQYHAPVPTNYQWTVSVEQQFGSQYSTELAYVGNHGTNLNFPVNINEVPGTKLGPNDQGNVTYPLFGTINGSTNNAISNYNALQAQITKRFNQGLEFNFNYTWSHFLDDQDSSGWGSRGGWQNYQNAFCASCNYSQSNFDIRNMFKGQAIYQLPLGIGREYLNHSKLLDAFVGGWQTSGTIQIQSGNPLLLTTAYNDSTNNQSGGYTQYPNLIGNYSTSGRPRSQRLLEWYNQSAFAVPAPYTYGNFNRNIVTGPGINVVNFSLGKTFNLWPERGVKLEIRSDAQNVFNHPSFGQPGLNIGPGGSAAITSTTVGGRIMQLYGRISF